MPKLSIVVPVYNVEAYLDECIVSIVKQVYTDFELILVDDGSTDASGKICDEWAEKDKRIAVFRKENGGLMSAWKYGVEKATGEYVGFVDSDDWIDCDMYYKMMMLAEEQQVDLVCASLVMEEPGAERRFQEVRLRPGLYGRDAIEKEIYPALLISERFHSRGLTLYRVTKVCRREVLLRVLEDCDESVSLGEDILTTFSLMQNVQSLYLLDGFYPYHYRIRSDSTDHKFDKDNYTKLEVLRAAMLRVNEKYGRFDFRTQIHTDYIVQCLIRMEYEILSTTDYKSLKESLKEVYSRKTVQQSLGECDRRMLRKRHKMYLFLLRNNLFGVMIFIRKKMKHC